MPVMILKTSLLTVNTNSLTTGLTDVCIKILKASTAAGLATLHDIPPGTQGQVTLQTAEVLFMPAHTFSFHALRGEDQLIARRTTRAEEFCMMPSTVNFSISMEIYEIHKGLVAGMTDKAGRMPAELVSQLR